MAAVERPFPPGDYDVRVRAKGSGGAAAGIAVFALAWLCIDRFWPMDDWRDTAAMAFDAGAPENHGSWSNVVPAAGNEVAADHVDVYLTWGEPPADVAANLANRWTLQLSNGGTVVVEQRPSLGSCIA